MKKSNITLREFISKYVDYNTSCKLWIPYTGDEEYEHQLVLGEYSKYSETQEKILEIAMEWEILKGDVPQSKYLDCTFTGVINVYSDKFNDIGVVNLTVLADNVKEELYQTKDTEVINCTNNID